MPETKLICSATNLTEIFSKMYHRSFGMMHICFILCFVQVCKMICAYKKRLKIKIRNTGQGHQWLMFAIIYHTV
jgi:hypothetical protein